MAPEYFSDAVETEDHLSKLYLTPWPRQLLLLTSQQQLLWWVSQSEQIHQITSYRLFNRSKGHGSGCTAALSGMHCSLYSVYCLIPPPTCAVTIHKSCTDQRWKLSWHIISTAQELMNDVTGSLFTKPSERLSLLWYTDMTIVFIQLGFLFLIYGLQSISNLFHIRCS